MEIITKATIFKQKGTSDANELENKIQQFSTSDYSVSENGKEKTYTIHSDALKRKLWDDYLKNNSIDNRERVSILIQDFKVIISEELGHGYTIFSDNRQIATVITGPTDKLFQEREREREREQFNLNNPFNNLFGYDNINDLRYINENIRILEDHIKKNEKEITYRQSLSTKNENDFRVMSDCGIGIENCKIRINSLMERKARLEREQKNSSFNHGSNHWEHKWAECHNYTLTDLGSPNGSRDYEWIFNRVVEIGDLILKLEDQIFHFERECKCKKPDCHKQLKARDLKEQISILDNERKELKERINNRSSGNGSDKPTKEEWEQEKSAQESGGDYSLTSIIGRKYGGICSDCGAKGELTILKYIECDICKERTEGDDNWRCKKCNDKKYPRHSCVFKKQKNKNEAEKDNKTNSSQNPINITISNNVNGDNSLENKKLEQIIQEIEALKQKIVQLEKTGENPQKVQQLKHQVQSLEAQKQALNQQKSEPEEQEINKKETVPNSVPAKPENHKTILLVGGGLLIICVSVISYLVGKLKSKDGK